MSMLIACGAEYGSTAELDSCNCGVGTSGPTPRSGTYWWGGYTTGWSNTWLKYLPAAKTEIYAQIMWYLTNGASSQVFGFRSGSNYMAAVNFPNDGCFRAWTGNFATNVVTSPAKYAAGNWFLIEIHLVVATSGGTLEMRVNGISVGTFTGNTNPGGYGSVDNVYTIGPQYNYSYWDDLVVNDALGSVNNSWPAGVKIVAIRPTGAGTSAQLTPSAGQNYACVNEVPPSMAQFVSGATDGLVDTYAMGDISNVSQIIQAVKADAFIVKAGTPATANVKPAIRTGGNPYVGANVAAPLLTMGMASAVWDINPATGLAWTVADINALEAGVQLAT